jgi:hypothetical protein
VTRVPSAFEHDGLPTDAERWTRSTSGRCGTPPRHTSVRFCATAYPSGPRTIDSDCGSCAIQFHKASGISADAPVLKHCWLHRCQRTRMPHLQGHRSQSSSLHLPVLPSRQWPLTQLTMLNLGGGGGQVTGPDHQTNLRVLIVGIWTCTTRLGTTLLPNITAVSDSAIDTVLPGVGRRESV